MLHNEGKRKRPKPTSSAKQRAGKAETIPVEQKQEMKAKRKIFCFFVDIETRRPLYDELHFQNRTIDFWLDNEIGNWKYFQIEIEFPLEIGRPTFTSVECKTRPTEAVRIAESRTLNC